MAKGGMKKGRSKLKKAIKNSVKKAKKTSKKQAKIPQKKEKLKEAPKPAPAIQPVEVEQPVEQVRVLKKLPPAKPLDVGRQTFRVFGHPVDARKIKSAAVEAYSKRGYTVDDIPVSQYIKEEEWDNMMTKIGILDRIEEQLNLMYPTIDVVRKNKITIELYLKE